MPFSNLRKPELLSPAGSIEAVKAAIANGCDAIYLGGKQFNARAFAANFDNQQLEEVCDYAHLRRVKIYVTVNTLYKDSEFAELAQFIDQLSQMGVDGLIMQDLGAISFVRANFPDLPVHASTQLTSNSLDDVLFYQDLGVRTVVMSRELSIEEVRRCVENSHINIEVFVHGALCVGYSGQCLFSSLLGDRSGNRGKCAQGCRMYYQLAKGEQKYDEGYLISTKDICTLELLPQLIEAGVASFKIEGRMKSPQYVGLVTSIYRYYIDLYFKDPQHYSVRREDVERLLQIFNREGFSSGYFKTHSGLDMMSKNSPKDTGLRIGTVERYDVRNQKVQIRLEKPLHKADGIAIGTYGCGINQDYNANQLITLPFEGRCRSGDIVYRTFDKKLNDEVSAHLTGQFHYLQLKAYASFRSDQKAYLKLCDDNGHCVEAYGETVQKALKQPVGSDRIREQLLKTGNTVYQISELQIEADEDIFMPLSQINQLRAKACEMMDETIIRSYKRKPAAYRLDSPQERGRSKKAFSALVATSQQLEAVCRYPQITRVYMQMNGEMMNELDEKISAIHQSGKQAYMALPRIMRDY
ncbi:MAG: U32 family peptidase, partial [Erysipelotrichaceae bacterium]|nr:U32 family peptidase [Erysipelotrichaceae bacterium]